MRSPYFTEDHERFRQRLRALLARDIAPRLNQWERAREMPREVWRQLGAAGLLGLHHPVEYGGGGADLFHSVILLEELGLGTSAGFRAAVAVHAYMATTHLSAAGSDELKMSYLAPAIAGERIAALAITEPQAGSDIALIQTQAERDADDYVINGAKQFVANGTCADFIVLAARTAPQAASARGMAGISLFVVDRPSAGLEAHRLPMVGWLAADVAELRLRDVRVPARNLIGSPGQGFLYLMRNLQLERLAAGLMALGSAESCIRQTWSRLRERQAFGGPLSRMQALRHRMADLLSELMAVRQLAYHAAWQYAAGELPITECSMVKLKATELARHAAQECLQLHGAHGYVEGSAIARLWRDAAATTMTAGASEVMRDIIAQSGLDEAGADLAPVASRKSHEIGVADWRPQPSIHETGRRPA